MIRDEEAKKSMNEMLMYFVLTVYRLNGSVDHNMKGAMSRFVNFATDIGLMTQEDNDYFHDNLDKVCTCEIEQYEWLDTVFVKVNQALKDFGG